MRRERYDNVLGIKERKRERERERERETGDAVFQLDIENLLYPNPKVT